MNVVELPLVEAFHRPLGGFVEFGRDGEPGTIAVCERRKRIHHLRVIEGLFFDLVNEAVVDFFLSEGRKCQKNRDECGRPGYEAP